LSTGLSAKATPPIGWRDILRPTIIGIAGVHVAAIVGVIACGFSLAGVALAVGVYFARMVVVTAAYHRYFAHRTYKTSRWFQFVLAVGALSAAQRGVIWWASHHRWHHKHSDTPKDVHSTRKGFWYAHILWIFDPTWNGTDHTGVADLARYPELRALEHPLLNLLPSTLLAVAFFLIGGSFGLVWGYFVSSVLVWHGSFAINSFAHYFGRQRYETGDDSRNSMILAILTTGEGWHNNHHYYQSSARQGFRWWEIDLTYYVLRLVGLTGLIWDIREPPRHIVDAPRPEALADESASGPARAA
jgi:stearoyl-CoA desaturase (delta-9 desaturase)